MCSNRNLDDRAAESWEIGIRRPRGERATAYAELLSQLKRAVK